MEPSSGGEYWAENMRKPVRFAQEVQQMMERAGHGLYIEMSPNPLLVGAIEEIRQANQTEGRAMGSLRRGQDERGALLSAVGMLWVQGYEVAWGKQFPSGGRRVGLPTYAWQRQRHWVEGGGATAGVNGHGRRFTGGHPLTGSKMPLSTQPPTYVWETSVDVKRLGWLGDHRVRESVVFPGTGYVEIALSCGHEIFQESPYQVTDLEFCEALVLAGDKAVQLQVVAMEEQPGRLRFHVASATSSLSQGAFRMNARGLLHRAECAENRPRLDLAAVRARLKCCGAAVDYAALTELGLAYGPAFQGLSELWRGDNEALGHVHVPPAAGPTADYQIHPALLDACFQVMGGAMSDQDKGTLWVPVSLRSVRLLQRPTNEIFCHVRLAPLAGDDPQRRCADLLIVNGEGEAVAEISGLTVQRLARGVRSQEEDSWFLAQDWEYVAVPAPKIVAGRWLLLGDNRGIGVALRSALDAAGHAVVHAVDGLASTEGLRSILAAAFEGSAPTAVVYLGRFDGKREAGAGHAELLRSCDSALATVQALIDMGPRDSPRLWLVTHGAQAVAGGEVCIEDAPLLGLGRVVAMEHAELRCGRLDLDPANRAGEVDGLVAELLADDAEEEVAWRGGKRYVARLVHRSPASGRAERIEPARGRHFRLEIDETVDLHQMVLRSMERHAPGPGQVEIEVEAAGCGFRDIELAMGAMSKEGQRSRREPRVGSECAGRVVAVGDGVLGLSPGDSVIVLAADAIASHITTSAALILPRPPGFSAIEAAAMPESFLTAYYALARVARLDRGERVLIHSATSSVGLAAVQWAQHVGAEVYATEDTPEKRAYLQALGVRYVSDARSDQLIADVHAWSAGEGVDVVLSSLAGERMEKSLQLLRDSGRFVAVGCHDLPVTHQIAQQSLQPNLSVSVVDLRALMAKQPNRVRSWFEELSGLIVAGRLQLPPISTLPIGDVGQAFRQMQQGSHIGKWVLTFGARDVPIHVPVTDPAAIRADSSYLVTGGLGGLGLSVAGWLAEQGAGHLVLSCRSGASSSGQRAAVAALSAKGTRVTVAMADVADRVQVQAIVSAIATSGMPLRGLVHAAGVIDDGLLEQQTPSRFHAVMAPKILGAMNLHELTRELPLDFFVLYASGAGLIGSPGQANYAAANAFLDALAHHRRAQDLPSLSIDWGPFSDLGLAAAETIRGARLATRGMRSLTPSEGLAALARLLAGSEPQVGVVPLNLLQWVEFDQAVAKSRRLSRLWAAQQTKADGPVGDRSLLDPLAAAEPGARAGLLANILRQHVSQVLLIPESAIDLEAPLTSLGMDSLMGLELRNRIEARSGIAIPATAIWSVRNTMGLARYIVERAYPTAKRATPTSLLEHPAQMIEDVKRVDALTPHPTPFHPSQIVAPRHILLTGSTGFVGAYLAERLLRQTQADLYCLVRAASHELAAARLRQNLQFYGLWNDAYASRLHGIVGDVGAPRFGLDESAFMDLAEKIDVVYHNAALVDWVRSYQDLRASNVLSILEMLRFCALERGKPLHYISSMVAATQLFVHEPLDGATPARTHESEPRPLDDTYLIHHGMTIGYAQSKWVADEMVLRARQRGYVTSIYRLPFVIGDSETGLCISRDYLVRLIKTCIDLEAIPEVDGCTEMIPVDAIARLVVDLALQERTVGMTFNLVDPKPQTWRMLVDLLKQRGYRFVPLEAAVWTQRIKEDRSGDRNHGLYPVLPTLEAMGGTQLYGFRPYQSGTLLRLSQLTTERFVASDRWSFATQRGRVISKMLDHLQATGIIRPPSPKGTMASASTEAVGTVSKEPRLLHLPSAQGWREQVLASVIDVLTSNQAGLLGWEHLDARRKAIQRIHGWPEGTPNSQRLQSAFQGFWQELTEAGDVDGDGCISLSDLRALSGFVERALVDTGKLPVWAIRLSHALFSLLDLDGDRQISKRDYEQFMSAMGLADSVQACFEVLDLRSCGFVDRDGLEEVFSHFFIS